ncbi:MAG: shikimate dehydrogenase [Burkholderiales bacterium]|nr:MAG: shikimate dehydrogenase [Burkholderiales bacterium]TAG77698.1 MAG: shikimate dehydrogenase [Betaproteobacteria bacterium]
MIPISGKTRIFPVIGWPVEQVKAPAIYNAYFSQKGIDAVCVPMRVPPTEYASFVRSMMSASNVGGICVSIPHKPASVSVADVSTRVARVAGAANAIYRNGKGEVVADLIDGEGFVRALDRTAQPLGFPYAQSSALIVGCGGVGCAIAAALAERGIAALCLVDVNTDFVEQLATRLRAHYPALTISLHNYEVGEFDLLVNGTPLGMTPGDAMPFSVDAAKPSAIIADCGMKTEMTELLQAAAVRGLRIQKGKEMLFEQAPLYMERFGWPNTTADEFRALGVL